MKLMNKCFLTGVCLIGFSGLSYGMEEQIIEKKEETEKKELPASLDSSELYRLNHTLFWQPSQIKFYFDHYCDNMVQIIKDKNFSIYRGFAQVAYFLKGTDALTWIGKEQVQGYIVELCKKIIEKKGYIELETKC